MKSISHSQFSAYNECNLKWKLRYIDKLSKFSGSIHTVFGTAMHTTIQAYLTEFYNKSIKSADSMDLPTMLKEEMIKEFVQIRKQHNVDVCDQKELTEFYEDGVAIIEGFKKDRAKYFFSFVIDPDTSIMKKIHAFVAAFCVTVMCLYRRSF